MSRTVYDSNNNATIANGGSLSNAIPLGGAVPCALVLPAAWTAANITFSGSVDGVNFGSIFDGDAGAEAEYKLTTTFTAASGGENRAIPLNPDRFQGYNWIKVRSGTQGAPVAQGAQRVIQIGLRDFS